MTQDATTDRDPIEEYWASYGKPSPFQSEPLLPMNWSDLRDQYGRTWEQLRFAHDNPWVNGRYALAAIVWGGIALVVFGVGAGP